MEFEQQITESINQEADQELLQLQRRKSMPKVVIEEFVPAEDEEGQQEENTPHKVKTHHEIDDVSNLTIKMI